MSEGGTTCPSCGGAGGGPFGRPGSAWDVETYVCPRCRGLGILHAGSSEHRLAKASAPPVVADSPGAPKPGIAGTRPPAVATRAKRRSSPGA